MANSQNEKNKYLTPSWWQEFNAIFNPPKTESERLMEQRMAVQAPNTYLGSQTAKFLGALLGYSLGQNSGDETMGVNSETTQALAKDLYNQKADDVISQALDGYKPPVDLSDMNLGINTDGVVNILGYETPYEKFLKKIGR